LQQFATAACAHWLFVPQVSVVHGSESSQSVAALQQPGSAVWLQTPVALSQLSFVQPSVSAQSEAYSQQLAFFT
jgi:hypothetical protein